MQPSRRSLFIAVFMISTHTPLTGCNKKQLIFHLFTPISTHTPLTGCNGKHGKSTVRTGISTHTPLTGCNVNGCIDTLRFEDFYSHTPHGVQQLQHTSGINSRYFYSHTPHGVQHMANGSEIFPSKFLLTHPSRGATRTF